jgi:hypothetical protein
MVWAAASTCGAAEEVVTIPTRTGVVLTYLLVHDPSASPKVVVISFVGGEGAVNLVKRSADHPPSFGAAANFLVRIRSEMTDADIADAIVDSPSDKLPQGMTDDFRFSADHLADIRALALSTFNFATIKIPVLLVHHREDGCTPNPYYKVERLSKSFALISVSGGDPPQSGPCDSQSPHGYFGRDAAVVQAIKNWMLGRDFAREIG